MDERVLDMPFLSRFLLVNGIIVPFRAPKSAKKYSSIWTEEGSPLIVHTKNLVKKVQQEMPYPCYYSMRYGLPDAEGTLKKIHTEHTLLEHLIVFPLYPHYAMSSYETAIEQIKSIHKKYSYSTKLSIVLPYYAYPSYIRALSHTIYPYIQKPYDHILFSYHGIPVRHLKQWPCTKDHCMKKENCCNEQSAAHSYCYLHQVKETTKQVAQYLSLKQHQYSISFQSRLGNDAWIQPYTTQQLKTFPSKGIKNLLIICPAFVSDCLETLEEIAIEGKEDFLHAGGESFTMIPALNENEEWIQCIHELIYKQIEKLS